MMRARVKGWSLWRVWRAWSHGDGNEEGEGNEHAEDDEDVDHEHDEDVDHEHDEDVDHEHGKDQNVELPPFWVLVTDVVGKIILYYDTFILLERYTTAESEHLLTFTVPISDSPLPPNY
ncbi:hypothetical protein DFH05DRAFT_1620127 [Lentinula detonsa]|uniref:Uncharacterized protein n=1 Tax=Lentinula detonsa TaxID=2804962 RepID=A0A9W8TWX7_9AGAR|nr:hypothetical protein DFH05DRAFT_1620127 [Lentinula detonsa]